MAETAGRPAPAAPVATAGAAAVATVPPSAPDDASLRRRADLWTVALAVLGTFAAASALDLYETFARVLLRFERWQADELPLALLVLAIGSTWYATRRRSEAVRELARRRQAEAEASALLAHNRELARRLIEVQESERRALARELHDELGQHCSALLVETAGLRRRTGDAAAGPRPDAADGTADAAVRADDAARAIYRMVGGLLGRLRPVHLDTLGLVASLEALCEAWEEGSGVPCIFHHRGLGEGGDDLFGRLPDSANITVYRVVQESLTNVRRHAKASSVRVRLTRPTAGELRLEVQDDGQGLPAAAAAGRAGAGLGLLGAAERAAAVGGALEVRSTPGSGVQVRLCIPLAA